MISSLAWGARALLAAVLAFALYGAISPTYVHALVVAPDALEHALFAFVIIVLGAAAFPRAPLVLLAAPLPLAATGLEGLQAAGMGARTYPTHHVVSNLVGGAPAFAALAAAQVGARLRE